MLRDSRGAAADVRAQREQKITHHPSTENRGGRRAAGSREPFLFVFLVVAVVVAVLVSRCRTMSAYWSLLGSLVGLLFLSWCPVSNALVTGKIQLKPAQPRGGWVRYSNEDDSFTKSAGDVSSVNSDMEKVTGESRDYVSLGESASPQWNATVRRSTSYAQIRDQQKYSSPPNYESMEDKSKRELEWIVRNTEKILGPESPAVGSMNQGMMKLTSNLMSAWSRRAAKREGSKSPHVVERLLQRLIQERDAGNKLASIDTFLYNKVLEAWAYSSEEGSAERSEEILHRMERMYLEDGDENVKPNESSYNAVVKAYVKNGNRHIAAAKVESVVKRMENRIDVMGVSPNRRSYNLLLYAFANSNLEDAAIHSEEILHKMSRRHVEEGDGRCKPDINSYNQVITAWARGTSSGFEERMQAVYQELLNLPSEMEIRPNADSFNAVMGGWLKSDNPSSLEIIQRVLETMESAYAAGNAAAKPDRVTINTLTAAYIKNGHGEMLETSIEAALRLEQKYQVVSNTVSYNIVIDSWCKSGRADAPDQAMGLLDTMEKACKKGKTNMRPDGYTYCSVIGCFVKFKRKDATDVAEGLLKRMRNLYYNFDGKPPTTSVYNSVINSWATCAHPDLGQRRIKEILQIMEENNGKDPFIPRPNRITYNTVIKAMRDGKTKNADYAEEILTRLEEKGTVEPHMLPCSYSYTSTITAFGRSDCPDKAEKSFQILERMLRATEKGNMAATPTTHSYNAVLNACAFVRGAEKTRLEAFEIAMKTYDMLKEKGMPDHTTYGTLLRICATLVPAADTKREALVSEIFEKACETGNCGRLVITQLRFASTQDQFVRLTGRESHDQINFKDFPKSWNRNVREASRRTPS
jgi:hypothetical protein